MNSWINFLTKEIGSISWSGWQRLFTHHHFAPLIIINILKSTTSPDDRLHLGESSQNTHVGESSQNFQFKSYQREAIFQTCIASVAATEYNPSKLSCCLNAKTNQLFKIEIWKNRQWILLRYKMQSCTYLSWGPTRSVVTHLKTLQVYFYKIADDAELYCKS